MSKSEFAKHAEAIAKELGGKVGQLAEHYNPPRASFLVDGVELMFKGASRTHYQCILQMPVNLSDGPGSCRYSYDVEQEWSAATTNIQFARSKDARQAARDIRRRILKDGEPKRLYMMCERDSEETTSRKHTTEFNAELIAQAAGKECSESIEERESVTLTLGEIGLEYVKVRVFGDQAVIDRGTISVETAVKLATILSEQSDAEEASYLLRG